ncbi:hypothetical protein ACH4TV_21875 [Streptomyces sp. NPDC020898]|uniref:hypothetical protein n=1 Tax=Streptomyces sp. NPDC020898 TaxID=3365101 RepID=UPI0037A88CBF
MSECTSANHTCSTPSGSGLLARRDEVLAVGRASLVDGDADDRRLVKSIRPRSEAAGGRLHVDVLKVAHHGSGRNISNDLLDLLDCDRYVISTSGARHNHPDDVALSRILYRDRAAPWDVSSLKDTFGYTVTAPEPDAEDGFVTFEL